MNIWISSFKDSRVENLPIEGSDDGPIEKIFENKALYMRSFGFIFQVLVILLKKFGVLIL